MKSKMWQKNAHVGLQKNFSRGIRTLAIQLAGHTVSAEPAGTLRTGYAVEYLKPWFHVKIKLFKKVLGLYGTTSEMK